MKESTKKHLEYLEQAVLARRISKEVEPLQGYRSVDGLSEEELTEMARKRYCRASKKLQNQQEEK